MLDNDIFLLEIIERYYHKEMSPEEVISFEKKRRENPSLDAKVVEYLLLLQQLSEHKLKNKLQNNLNKAFKDFAFHNHVYVKRAKKHQRVYSFFKYKRVMAIAAMVAGIIAAIGVFSLTLTYPKINPNKIEKLSRDVAMIIRTQTYQNAKINEVNAKIPKDVVATNGGTGFLIDTKGFIITNAHVIGKSHYVDVVNCSGQEFHASIIFMDNNTDIALLQIQDSDFVRPLSLPYVIKDNLQNIGEEVYTLGYPKNDIVYNAGYLSSISGYNGDTSNYQVQLDVNPGNSGGPLFNKKGEVIGILSTREINANSVAFAIKSKSIFNLVDSLRSDMHKNIKINESNNLISAYNRITQIKKEESYIYLVRSFQ